MQSEKDTNVSRLQLFGDGINGKVAGDAVGGGKRLLTTVPKLTILYTHHHTCITVTVDTTANP